MENEIKPLEEGAFTSGEVHPKIYSKRAINIFSILFSAIFGAILLMQNLRDIGKKKEANLILLGAIVYTGIFIYLVNIPEKPQTSLTFLGNLVAGYVLSEILYKKYFPQDEQFEKKKIWKPLIISILIMIPFVLAVIYA